MAFGDFLNDLEMMDAATYSFAMANAHPRLKERARWVAPTNNANAWCGRSGPCSAWSEAWPYRDPPAFR